MVDTVELVLVNASDLVCDDSSGSNGAIGDISSNSEKIEEFVLHRTQEH